MAPKTDALEYVPPIAPIGGISQQAPHVRFPHQVEDASNAVFNVADGASKRPGTWFVRDITALLPGDLYRLHPIDRDEEERYGVVYGADSGTTSLLIEELGGLNLSAFVDITAAAQAYLDLNSPTADDLRLITVADSTFILNTTVPVGLTDSDAFQVDRTRPDYASLIAFTSTINYYLRTENDSLAAPKGYYQYVRGDYGYGHINLITLSGDWVSPTGFWDDSGKYPAGFRIGFRRVALAGFTGGTWTAAARTLLKTGAFTGYTHRPGDMIYVTSGTGWTAGWKRVASRDNNDQVTLESQSGLAGADNSNTACNDSDSKCRIGMEVEVSVDAVKLGLTDMHQIAAAFQSALRDQGAENACVAYVAHGTAGAMQITGPWRGDNATVYPPTAPTVAGVYDLSQASHPFDGTGNYGIYAGVGGAAPDAKDTATPESRWVRVAAPSQEEAKLDPATMPVQMKRTLTSASQTIVGNTAANPTVVNCPGHGLRSGQETYWISSNSTPVISGTKVATVIDDNHFSVPVNVSVAGTSGIFRRAAVFDVDVAPWNPRTSGDKLSNPAPSIWQDGRKIADIGFQKDRLVLAAGESVVYSQQGDIFNFFVANAANIVDSDPIDLTLSAERITKIDYLTHFKKGITLFTLAGQQFDLSATDELTASKVAATPTTNYQTRRVRPRTINEELYFTGRDGCRTQILEYRDDNADVLAQRAADVTAHVPTLLPEDVRAMAVATNTQTVVVLPDSGEALYVYRSFWAGTQKQQSAWTKYDFDPSYVIYDIVVIADRFYMLTKTANLWFLERLPVSDQPDICHYDDIDTSLFATSFAGPYIVHLDRKFYREAGTGTFGSGKTTWNLGVQTPGSTVNRVVRLDTGQEYAITGWSGTTVELAGVNLSGVNVIIGCAYDFSVTLTRPFYLDSQGRPNPSLDCTIEKLIVMHSKTGDYTVSGISSEPNTAADNKPFNVAASGGIYGLNTGSFDAAIHGDAAVLTVKISNTTARPTIITGVQWILGKAEGGR